MRRLASLFGIAAVYLFVGSAVAGGVVTGKVVKVVDGDTIHVLDAGRSLYKVRFGAIDAPERGQPYYRRSREHLSSLVAGQTVSVQWHKTDQYRRLVGKVLLKGTDVGLVQVEDGFAWYFTRFANEQSLEDRRAYEAAEERARKRRLNIWREGAAIPPWEERSRKRRVRRERAQ